MRFFRDARIVLQTYLLPKNVARCNGTNKTCSVNGPLIIAVDFGMCGVGRVTLFSLLRRITVMSSGGKPLRV